MAPAAVLLAVTAATWLALGAAGLILEARIFGRLRGRHPTTWEELGRPWFLRRLWSGPSRSFFRSGQHRSLGDATLTRMVAIQRWVGWAYVASFAGFLAAAFLGTS